MRKAYWTVLFLSSILCFSGTAYAGNQNWCGVYFEENNHGYIVVSLDDIEMGSKNCTIKSYKNATKMIGSAIITLDFTKNRSKIGNWRKFSNHYIEVRGKMRDRVINNPRFVRDYGA
jgi:hypothetical protein